MALCCGQTTAGTEGTRAATAHARLHAGKVLPSSPLDIPVNHAPRYSVGQLLRFNSLLANVALIHLSFNGFHY